MGLEICLKLFQEVKEKNPLKKESENVVSFGKPLDV